MTDDDLAAALEPSSRTLRALESAEKTRFGVIRIEPDSPLRCQPGLMSLRESLSNVGLNRTRLYKDGAHLWYLFVYFDTWVDSAIVQRLLESALVEADNRSSRLCDTYPGALLLPLPLQAGFAWLDDAGSQMLSRDDLTTAEAIEKFLSDMNSFAQGLSANSISEKPMENATASPSSTKNLDDVQAVQTSANPKQLPDLSSSGGIVQKRKVHMSGQRPRSAHQLHQRVSTNVQLSMPLAFPSEPIALLPKVLPEPRERRERILKRQPGPSALSLKEEMNGSPKTEDTS